MEEAVAALPRVLTLDRRGVRRRFEERFSATRMAKDYVNVYRTQLQAVQAHEELALLPIPEILRTISKKPYVD
jgi:hypothetical protein